MMTPSALPLLDTALIDMLRADLAAADWTVEHMEALLSQVARDGLMRDQRIPALVELSDNTDPAAILTRLFILGSTEKLQDIATALPSLTIAGALSLGLLRLVGDTGSGNEPAQFTYSAVFDLRPHAAQLPNEEDPSGYSTYRWWVLSDLGESITGQPLHPDHVLGIGGASVNLLTLTTRDHVSSALDMGTGCGIQALYLTTHADRVVATDLSSRAAVITAFNAALNHVAIEVRCGSLFEPVEGEQFDLIVSNPPFVITPDSVREKGVLEYRDGGRERDSLIAEIIRNATAHLSPDGMMQMLGNWEISEGADPETEWSTRVEHWLEELPVDAWVLQRDILDPAQYVEMWLRDSGGTYLSRPEYEATYTDWISDFARAGVGAIGMGSLALRRRTDGCEGTRSFTYIPGGNPPRGEDVTRFLAFPTMPEDIWETALHVAPDVTEERYCEPGNPDPAIIILRQGGNMGRSFSVGAATAALVGACDGELTLSQIINALTLLLDTDEATIQGEISAVLPDLLASGILTYAEKNDVPQSSDTPSREDRE